MESLHINTQALRQFKADCAKCSGLCCVALYYSKADGFPEDKAAGKPCENLQDDFRCGIHRGLKARGLRGCAGYDCFGAGQHVTQITFGGVAWPRARRAVEIFDVYVKMAQLFQMRFYLAEAAEIIPAQGLASLIQGLAAETEALCSGTPQQILGADLAGCKGRAARVLGQVCSLIKEYLQYPVPAKEADYVGKSFKGRDMRRVDLGSRLLIGADFSGCLLGGSIFLGADTRDTDFCNADLSGAVFLSQGQINAAKGNKNTKLPEHLSRPEGWTAG